MKHWARAARRRFAGLGRIGWIAAAVFGGALALMAGWALLSWEDSFPTKPVDEMAYLVCLLFAVGCAVKAARAARGRRRYGWLTLIVALSAWAVGEVIRIFEEVQVDSHLWHPSLAQGVLMVYPVAAYAALLLLGDLEKAPRRRMVLDGVIVATSLFVVSWVCVLNNLSGDAGAPGATALHITADVVLMTTAILVWSRPLGRVERDRFCGGHHHSRGGGHRQCLRRRGGRLPRRRHGRPGPRGGFRHVGLRSTLQRRRPPVLSSAITCSPASGCGFHIFRC